MIDYETDFHEALGAGSLSVPNRWEGFPERAFGGFLTGAALVAAAGETEHPRPLSVAARYHRPVPVETPVALEVREGKRGRSLDTLDVKLRAGERDLASATVVFGREGDAPMAGQAVPPIRAMSEPRAVADLLEEQGLFVPPLMRRLRFRGEPGPPPIDDTWHLHAQWPGTACESLAVRAAVAAMPIDNFVGPAAIHANRLDINAPWPAAMISIDLAAWFYAPEAAPSGADAECAAGWLTSRTSVPVCNAGYAVGRTQVWSGERLVAEGMSQVALLPPMPEPPVA